MTCELYLNKPVFKRGEGCFGHWKHWEMMQYPFLSSGLMSTVSLWPCLLGTSSGYILPTIWRVLGLPIGSHLEHSSLKETSWNTSDIWTAACSSISASSADDVGVSDLDESILGLCCWLAVSSSQSLTCLVPNGNRSKWACLGILLSVDFIYLFMFEAKL